MVSEKRNKMIEDNLGLVHSLANRFRNRGAEYDDLYQAGCVGLIKAVDNFDESRGFAFSTYAVPVILGEIKRIFRDGGTVKVSRSLKEKSLKAKALSEKFIKQELREPTVSELSEMLGCDLGETAEILNVINPALSLSADEENGDFDIPVDESEKMFDRIILSSALSQLSSDEKIIVEKRYFQGATQSDVAKLLGVSQVQISRKEKAILTKLRKKLE